VKLVAVDLSVLGDVEPLWNAWLEDAARRTRVELDPDPERLHEQLPNWGVLLERFAEERAPVYLRRRADTAAALRRLHEAGAWIAVFTDFPLELAQVALAQLGATRRIHAVGTLDDVRAMASADPVVVRTREELTALSV
jgi:phosphoglycolate phosphatase-like HAD superfamily hydrolase